MSARTTTQAVVDAILSGEMDDGLDAAVEAVRTRRSVIRDGERAKALGTLRAGQEAVLQGLSPKYLNGQRVRIRSVDAYRAEVEWLAPEFVQSQSGGRYGGWPTRVPLTCLKVQEAGA